MVTEPTVLVLGAGASFPYGFPVGSGLAQRFVENFEFAERNQLGKDLCAAGMSYLDMKEFRRRFMLSAHESIDAFLERYPAFETLGKMTIAACLIPNEKPKALLKHDWYHLIFRRLCENEEHNPNATEPLTILTYNYDRSFEQFIFDAYKHRYDWSDADAASKARQLEPIHLHGDLGALPHQSCVSRHMRAYDPIVYTDQLKACVHSIKIIHEKSIDDSWEYQRAWEALDNAKRICFLGFGFNRINLNRLLKSGWVGDPKKTIIGSAYGLQEGEFAFQERFGHRLRTADLGCQDFIRQHPECAQFF